jgi:cytochrome d ubiquinol oxidase subunit I
MQFPAGTEFNPATGRFEMTDFFAVAFSPMAVTKFCHTVLSAWILGSVFVIGIASWYLLKKRNTDFALKSIKVAAIFGLVASALTAVTGDTSAKVVADKQPMKLAAMEGLYHGGEKADLVTFAIPNPGKSWNNEAEKSFLFSLPSVPGGLSWLATSDTKAYIPGITDILLGDTLPDGSVLLSFAEKQKKGNEARTALAAYQQAAIAKDSLAKSSDKAAIAALEEQMDEKAAIIKANEKYLGYGYLEKPEDAIPNVQITFWSFHIMVYLGGFFILLFLAVVWFHYKKQLAEKRWLQRVALWSIPLAYIAGMAGWMVAEIGRQPWAIQDFLPLNAAISRLTAYSVMITFFLFLALFTALAIAEVRIMLNQIKKGPAEVETAAPDTENS